jgi:hypothetical protein
LLNRSPQRAASASSQMLQPTAASLDSTIMTFNQWLASRSASVQFLRAARLPSLQWRARITFQFRLVSPYVIAKGGATPVELSAPVLPTVDEASTTSERYVCYPPRLLLGDPA